MLITHIWEVKYSDVLNIGNHNPKQSKICDISWWYSPNVIDTTSNCKNDFYNLSLLKCGIARRVISLRYRNFSHDDITRDSIIGTTNYI